MDLDSNISGVYIVVSLSSTFQTEEDSYERKH